MILRTLSETRNIALPFPILETTKKIPKRGPTRISLPPTLLRTFREEGKRERQLAGSNRAARKQACGKVVESLAFGPNIAVVAQNSPFGTWDIAKVLRVGDRKAALGSHAHLRTGNTTQPFWSR